jgi:hypothetical protein
MTKSAANTPEFHSLPDATQDESAQLKLLREQWMQALCFTPGTSFRMETTEDRVTVTVSTQRRHLKPARKTAVVRPPVAPEEADAVAEGWLGLKLPRALRRQFRAVAFNHRIPTKDALRMLIEEVATSGRLPRG